MYKDHNMRKSMAGILAILFLIVTLFSSVYIIIESDHDCAGKDCHICHVLEVCEAILQRVENTLSSFHAVVFICFSFIVLQVSKSKISINRSLFDLKVRLNN